VAAVIGTLVSAMNQGTGLAAEAADTATWIRVGVNHMIPFCVASFGFLAARHTTAPVLSTGRGRPGGHGEDP